MNQQIPALLQKSSDSLQAARLLHREGYHDFAASRAYYAMFYLAQAFLLTKDLSFSSHAAVIAAFGREFAKTDIVEKKFHRYLLDSEDLRHSSDYGVGISIMPEQAETVLAWANEFLDMANSALGGQGS
jgi:uncharacterized protein (UPF0332 family)